MKGIWVIILILLASLAGAAQQSNDTAASGQPEMPAPLPLHVSSVNSSSLPGFTSWGEVQCDAEGNLYFRIGPALNESVVLRVSPDGRDHDLYSMPPDYQDKTSFVAFRVGASGNLSVLVESKEGIQVFSWKSASKEPDHTTLAVPEHISPLNFAVFNSGVILLAGYYNKDAPEAERGKNYLAEFVPSGKLKITFDRPAPAIDLSGSHPRLDAGATMDERGYLYLVSGDRVLVLSESGEVVIELAPRKPSPEFRVTNIRAAKGRLGVWFQKEQGKGRPVILRLALVDVQTGDVLRRYEPDAELGNNAVCFSGDAFTFFRVKDGYVRFLTAAVR